MKFITASRRKGSYLHRGGAVHTQKKRLTTVQEISPVVFRRDLRCHCRIELGTDTCVYSGLRLVNTGGTHVQYMAVIDVECCVPCILHVIHPALRQHCETPSAAVAAAVPDVPPGILHRAARAVPAAGLERVGGGGSCGRGGGRLQESLE